MRFAARPQLDGRAQFGARWPNRPGQFGFGDLDPPLTMTTTVLSPPLLCTAAATVAAFLRRISCRRGGCATRGHDRLVRPLEPTAHRIGFDPLHRTSPPHRRHRWYRIRPAPVSTGSSTRYAATECPPGPASRARRRWPGNPDRLQIVAEPGDQAAARGVWSTGAGTGQPFSVS